MKKRKNTKQSISIHLKIIGLLIFAGILLSVGFAFAQSKTTTATKVSSKSTPIICEQCKFTTNFSGGWTGRDFSGSMLDEVSFLAPTDQDLDMSGVIFDGSVFENSQFQTGIGTETVNLSNSSFSGVTLGVGFDGVSGTRINLTGINFSKAKTPVNAGVSIDHANAQNANFSDVNFKSGAFQNSDMQKSVFINAIIDNFLFANVNFTGATGFNTATLTNITWTNITCPDGTNSDNNGGTCAGHF